MGRSNRLIVSILAVAAVAIAFWVLVLSPKREEADKLGTEVEQLQVSLAEAQSKATEAAAAKREFPADYRQLVVLGKAVPESDETSSLFIELNQIADRASLAFESIQLNGGGETAEAAPAAPAAPAVPPPSTPATGGSPSAVPAAATIPPTEVAASVLPLGATVGTAGLGVMPYSLKLSGDFFHIADFIKGIDSLVDTGGSAVAVDGRLMTISGFTLAANAELDFPHLDANFAVTTYLTPPNQGTTVGATPSEPAPVSAESAEETESVPTSDEQ